jgi:[acyl-carrier-protein] S-malonyltransferase
MFPGQGSQYAGMTKDLLSYKIVRDTLDEVDHSLQFKLSQIMLEGPENELTETYNAQPAIITHSIAVLRLLEQKLGFSLAPCAKFVIGHSVGEISALTASGSMQFIDAVRLARKRGQAMQEATQSAEGRTAMAALLQVGASDFEEIKKRAMAHFSDTRVCDLANDNNQNQIVISGHEDIVDKAIEIAKKEFGVRRAVKLNVSAPFHSQLMKPAEDIVRATLDSFQLKNPCVPWISNVTAQPVSVASDIKELLTRQTSSSVRWKDVVTTVEKSIDTPRPLYLELGPKKTLANLIKQHHLAKNSSAISIGAIDDVKEFLLGYTV